MMDWEEILWRTSRHLELHVFARLADFLRCQFPRYSNAVVADY